MVDLGGGFSAFPANDVATPDRGRVNTPAPNGIRPSSATLPATVRGAAVPAANPSSPNPAEPGAIFVRSQANQAAQPPQNLSALLGQWGQAVLSGHFTALPQLVGMLASYFKGSAREQNRRDAAEQHAHDRVYQTTPDLMGGDQPQGGDDSTVEQSQGSMMGGSR